MEPQYSWFVLAGIIGSILIIGAFFASQNNIVRPDSPSYLSANLLGSMLILVSLHEHWNLPAGIIEGFWALISLYGLLRTVRHSNP